MPVSESYRVFVLEQLGRVVAVSAKSMFGGVGIYAEGLFFALIAEDRLYFKVDDTNRPDFERFRMEPFRPFGEDSAMGYYEVPADVVAQCCLSVRLPGDLHTPVLGASLGLE